MQSGVLWEAKEESPHKSRWGPSKGSFPGKEVTLERLSFVWKGEEAKGIIPGRGCRMCSFGSLKQHVQPARRAGDAG